MCKQVGAALGLLGLMLALGSVAVQGDEKKEKSGKAFLGISVVPNAKGLLVEQMAPDSPAAKGKLKLGDVIQKIGKTEVREYDQLVTALASHKPGDKVEVEVLRDGKEKELTVTLGERRVRGRPPMVYLGVQTQPLTPEVKAQLGVASDKGVVVDEVSPDTPAAAAGLKRGDVIVKAGGKEITEPRELREVVIQTGAGKDLELQVQRGKTTKELTAHLRAGPGEGLIVPPVPRTSVGGSPDLSKTLEMILDLQKKVHDLEKRVKHLEKKGGKSPE